MRGGICGSAEDQQRGEVKSALEELLREGARRMLELAVEGEVAEYAERHAGRRDEAGHRLVVRNGHLPERELVTGIGPVKVRQPRVNDRWPGHRLRSRILPRKEVYADLASHCYEGNQGTTISISEGMARKSQVVVCFKNDTNTATEGTMFVFDLTEVLKQWNQQHKKGRTTLQPEAPR